jgi:hypothetical protein
MKLEIPFNQGVLIQKTGSQMPAGICLGLVVQWLVSISQILSDEDQYWKDLKESSEPGPHSALLGVGYARKAIAHQAEYAKRFAGDDYSFIETVFNGAGLTRASGNRMPVYSGASAYAEVIANKALTDSGRYIVLVIGGQVYSHAIGLHRDRIMSDVQVFDPNIGKYACSSDPSDVAAAITDIFSRPSYTTWLNESWSWDCYK